MNDIIIRGGRIVLEEGIFYRDIAVKDGLFSEISKKIKGSAKSEIIAKSSDYIFPGIIDTHVHFNEPGREDWEGFETGSKSLARGGGCAFFDMPLNSHPPVLTAFDVNKKREVGNKKSVLDFEIWGGLTPKSLPNLKEMKQAGIIGLKAFLSPSGIDEFAFVDKASLKEGMKRARDLGLIVAVHAECPSKLLNIKNSHNKLSQNEQIQLFLDSRPISAEREAVSWASEIALETGCSLHIVHISSKNIAEDVEKVREKGANITIETCPHYLLCDEKTVFSKREFAKCAPPLRDEKTKNELLQNVLNGNIDLLSSDHSPTTFEKKNKNFLEAWGGISGCQHGFIILLNYLLKHKKEAHFPQISRCLSSNPAERFGLKKMGSIAVGNKANFFILSKCLEKKITKNDLLYKNKMSVYEGFEISWDLSKLFLKGLPFLFQ